jgi:RluA family pseudouridine synthase
MLVVVAEGPHWIVVDKPAGMTVVGGRGVPRPTLLDLAVERFVDARPVHRLDKPTTGCTLLAKSAFGQTALSDAFRRHVVDKRYIAVVEGVPTWESLVIDARLARIDDPDLPAATRRAVGKKLAAIQTVDDNGDRALTRVKVLARGPGHALIEARPETGRMHQIRVHLAHVGFPLVGDVLYGAKAAFVDEQEIALHALCVSFPKPEGGRGFVATALPRHWVRFCSDRGLAVRAVDDARARFLAAGEASAPSPSSSRAPSSKPSPSKPSSSKPSSKPSPSKKGWAKAKPKPSRGRR